MKSNNNINRTGYFPNFANVRLLKDGRSMELTMDFPFVRPNGKQHTAPRGLVVNGASIPRFFWRIIGPPLTGLYREASIIHDWHYQSQLISRAKADLIFLEGMKAAGVSLVKRQAMHKALRSFGWIAWNNNQKRRNVS
jgi:hypothetical protein